jgi:hypothetical protein
MGLLRYGWVISCISLFIIIKPTSNNISGNSHLVALGSRKIIFKYLHIFEGTIRIIISQPSLMTLETLPSQNLRS